MGTRLIDSHKLNGIKLWLITVNVLGAQWLSGRVPDSRLRGPGSQPHGRHCFVVLEKDTFILAYYWSNTGRPVLVNWKISKGCKESNQTNKTINALKFRTLGCLSKRHRQTAQTQIRLLLKKQSDQGLPCLLFWLTFFFPALITSILWKLKIKVWNFRTFTVKGKILWVSSYWHPYLILTVCRPRC